MNNERNGNNLKKSNAKYQSNNKFAKNKQSVISISDNLERVIYGFKVILLGDIQVGKTSIFNQFTTHNFNKNYGATLSVDFKVKSIFVDNNITADLQVWDTCGEEKFKTVTRQYYREINGCIIVFDITSIKSFTGAENWLDDLKENGPENCVTVLIGNKADLIEERKVNPDEAKFFASKNNISYYEVSALTGKNIKFVFDELTKAMINKSKEDDLILTNKKITPRNSLDRKKLISGSQTEFDSKMMQPKEKSCC